MVAAVPAPPDADDAVLLRELFLAYPDALLLIDERGERQLPHASKLALARELVREIAQRLPNA